MSRLEIGDVDIGDIVRILVKDHDVISMTPPTYESYISILKTP